MRNEELLSFQEWRVLLFVAKGMKAVEIASELSIQHQSVKTHLEHIYQKFEARNRADAVAIGFRKGYLA